MASQVAPTTSALDQGYSVSEVLEAIASETGESLKTPMGLRREGDPAELIADASSGRRELPVLADRQEVQFVVHRVGEPGSAAAERHVVDE